MRQEAIGDGIAFMKLSEVINGFKNGHLIFVGGKPNSGKTTFALSLINNLCLEKGKTVIFFSLEMSKEMIVRRLLRIQSIIDNEDTISFYKRMGGKAS